MKSPRGNSMIKYYAFTSRKFLGLGVIFKTQNSISDREYYLFEIVLFWCSAWVLVYKERRQQE